MPTVRRHLRFREIAAGAVVLLSIGFAATHLSSAPQPSGRPQLYVIINPNNGRVIFSGPQLPSGAIVTLNPKTGQIVKVSR
jgi:hypothetical protein